jgi:hypothetical protein
MKDLPPAANRKDYRMPPLEQSICDQCGKAQRPHPAGPSPLGAGLGCRSSTPKSVLVAPAVMAACRVAEVAKKAMQTSGEVLPNANPVEPLSEGAGLSGEEHRQNILQIGRQALMTDSHRK